MYTAVQSKLKSALDGFQPAACCTLATATAAAGAGRQTQKAAGSGAHVASGLELCRLSKLLLVAGGWGVSHEQQQLLRWLGVVRSLHACWSVLQSQSAHN